MHKSGTTLASQILHHSGINMGEEIDPSIGYGQGNKYERESTWRLNEEILECNGRVSIDIRAPAELVIHPEQRRRMRAIIRDLNLAYPDWGFKDPRTCLTYPLWAEELGEHKLLAISRPPADLYLRYRSKKTLRRYRNLAVAMKVLNRWIEHNSRIVAYLEHTQMDYLVLEYRRLMVEQGEFERLQAFADRELVDQRRKDLYRHRPDRDPRALQFAAWLIEKGTGKNPEKIAARLEEFRR
jgi:hypothetical protein